MALTGEQLRKLHDAVVDAIDDPLELARLVRHGMNVRLSRVVGPGGLDEVVFELLDWLETKGRVGEFIRVIREACPHNAELRKTLDEIEGVETPPPPLSSPEIEGVETPPPPLSADHEKSLLTRIRDRLSHARIIYIVLAVLVLAGSVGFLRWILVGTEKLPVQKLPLWNDGFVIKGKYIAYASPHTTYSILKERIDSARDSILVGIYDFKAIYIKDLLLNAMNKGVKKVNLIIARGGEEETAGIVDELTRNGADVTVGKSGFLPPFAVYHSKVIVIDGSWTLVQTANFTETGVPHPQDPNARQKGNRETGIALESTELARYFTRLLESDLQRIQNADTGKNNGPPDGADPVYQPDIDVPHFPALRGDANVRNTNTGTTQPVDTTGIRVLPVISPDNYLEVLTQVLASARESIDIYQQYIRPKSANVRKLLDAIKAAQKNNSNLTVRIILAYPFDTVQEAENWNILRGDYGWKFGDNLRILNPKTGLNSTNKLIIVDKTVSLVGSANWSELGVTKNREACVLIDSGEIATWYLQLFESDWKLGLQYENITDHK